MFDITANLSASDIRDAIKSADNKIVKAIDAINSALDQTVLAAKMAGVAYYMAPVGRGGRRQSGILDEVASMLKRTRWAKSDLLGLPNLQDRTTLMKFAWVGLVYNNGGVILSRKNDTVPPVGKDSMMTLMNKAYNGLGIKARDIEDAIVGHTDAQASYDSLCRLIASREAEKKAETKAETTKAETTKAETKVTTDADLVVSVLSILSGWHNDGTATIEAIFDKVAEIAAASIPATV